MKKKLIIYPSWEERSSKGFLRDYSEHPFSEVLLIRNSMNHCELFEEQLTQIENICKEKSIKIHYVDICNDSIKNWQALNDAIEIGIGTNDQVILDITTMSRNIVWSILYFLRVKIKEVSIVYHQPNVYTDKWISREPGQPRLLFKHSGIYDLSKEITLLLITGFDEERTRYILQKYEPKRVYLLVQTGEQFNNFNRNNVDVHRKICREFGMYEDDIVSQMIDAYSADLGYSTIESIVRSEENSNIILASFGPKPSAVSAYRCYMQHPEIALCYLPCKDYNIDYCQGIGESVSYTLDFPAEQD